MRSASPLESSIQRAIAYPCRGPHERVLRMSTSSVPWSKAAGGGVGMATSDSQARDEVTGNTKKT
jgi:hypothetical protein